MAGIVWTDANQDELQRLRAGGMKWDDIARHFRISRFSVVKQAQALGIWRPAVPVAKKVVHPTPTREAYPPGHSVTWGAITAGTLLAGVPYPLEIRLTRETAEERDEWEANMAAWRLAA